MNNTLLKGLRVIELLARTRGGMGVTDIARALALPKSNAHRLLQALVEQRYVIRHEAGTYGISIKLWELGSSALAGFDLRRHAESRMDALMEQTGESVHLSVLDQKEVVYVHKVESLNPVRAYSQIGGRVAAHCVATGKAMIAFKSDQWLRAMSQDLERATGRTIVDAERFMTEMRAIRRRGYAVNRGEWREAVSGVAAPIMDATGNVIAALGVSGPEARFKPTSIRAFAEAVVSTANELAQGMSGGDAHRALAHVTSTWRPASY